MALNTLQITKMDEFNKLSIEIGNNYLNEMDSISSLKRNSFTGIIVITDVKCKKYLTPLKKDLQKTVTAEKNRSINWIMEKDLSVNNFKSKIDENITKNLMSVILVFIPLHTDNVTALPYQRKLQKLVYKFKSYPLWKKCVVLASPPIPSDALNECMESDIEEFISNTRSWINFARNMCVEQNLSSGAMIVSSEHLAKSIKRSQYIQGSVEGKLSPSMQSWYDMVLSMFCIEPSSSSHKFELSCFKNVVLIGDQDTDEGFEWKTENTVFEKLSISLSETDLAISAFKMLSKKLLESPNTLFVILTDSTNWLTSQSFCRHMSHLIKGDDGDKNLYMYELGSQHRLKNKNKNKKKVDDEAQTSPISNYIKKTIEFVKKAHEYIHSGSAIIFTPIIPQYVLCPGMDEDVLTVLHSNIHQSPQKPLFKLFHPTLTSKGVISHLNMMDDVWMECVKKIMEMQQIPSDLVDMYVKQRLGGIAEAVDIDISCKDRRSVGAYPHWQGLIYAYVKLLTLGPERTSVETTLEKKGKKFEKVVLIGSFVNSFVSSLQMPNVTGIQEIIDIYTSDLNNNKELLELLNQKPEGTLFIFLLTFDCFTTDVNKYVNSKIFKNKDGEIFVFDKSMLHTNINSDLNSNQKSDIQKASNFLENFQAHLTGLGSVAVFVPLCPQVFYTAKAQEKSNKKLDVHAKGRHSPIIIPPSQGKKVSKLIRYFEIFSADWLILVRDILKKNNIFSKAFVESSKISKCIYGPRCFNNMEKELHNNWDECIKNFIRENCYLEKEAKGTADNSRGEVATDGYWCQVCKLSGPHTPASVTAHMHGSKHLKKIAGNELLQKLKQTTDCIDHDEVTGLFKCKVCNMGANSPQHLAVHLNSSKHKVKMEERSDKRKYDDGPNDTSAKIVVAPISRVPNNSVPPTSVPVQKLPPKDVPQHLFPGGDDGPPTKWMRGDDDGPDGGNFRVGCSNKRI